MIRPTNLIRSTPTFAVRRFLLPVLLGILLLGGYMLALSAGFHSDDFVILSQTQQERFGLAFFAVDSRWVFYRPLGKLLWLIMYQVFGDYATPYHILSLALHWVMTLLVVAFLRRLYPQPTLLAPGAGVLFALMPLHVETVVWISSQYDLLASVLYLATLLCFLLAWQRKQLRLYGLSLMLFQLCLWSKELAFTLPLLVLVVGAALPQRPRLRMIALSSVPYAVLVGINILQRYVAWSTLGGYSGAKRNYLFFVWDHLSATLTVLLAPLNRLVIPVPVVQIWLMVGATLVLAGLMAARNQQLIVFALAWLGATLVPVLNILPVGADLQSSRWLYLPSVGFCVGLVALLDAFARRFVAPYRQQVMFGSLGLISIAYLVVLWAHIQPWRIAGLEAIHTLQEIHRFVPEFSPNSTLQVAGLPDNYKGAYIFRIGLDTAHHQRYGSLFKLEYYPQLPPTNYEKITDTYQLAFSFDESNTRWEITEASGVTTAGAPLPTAISRRWDWTACTGASGWAQANLVAQCDRGAGLRLQFGSADPALISPPLDIASAGWTEVIVDLARLESSGDAVMQLFWNTQSDKPWTEARSVTMRLPADTNIRRYHVFLPPDTTGQPVYQLRLDPINTRDAVQLTQVAVRPIP